MSKRKQFTPEQKVAIVRRHLVEKVPVSDLCDELGIHANQYYNWQKQLFENARTVNWQFTASDARIKLRRFYPEFIRQDKHEKSPAPSKVYN